jgi:hypothetical protein
MKIKLTLENIVVGGSFSLSLHEGNINTLHTQLMKISDFECFEFPGQFPYTLIHTLTPWHYSPDGHKPPLIRFHSLIFSIFEEQVANLLPQHVFKSA